MLENNFYTRQDKSKCIHELFEEQVQQTPNAVALVFQGQQITYQHLNNRANQLAHYLQTLGVGPDVLVGLCIERSLEMVVGLLGILKAGGAYVPLDPNYPQERLSFMLADTNLPVLITQSSLVDKLPKHQAHLVSLDQESSAIACQRVENPLNVAKSDNLAYVMYTSGSTSQPKGVSVVHRGVVRLVKDTNYVNLTAQEVFLQLASICFDASTFEIWGCLLNGGKLVIFPSSTPSLAELGQVIQQYQVTTVLLISGLFNLMVDEQIEALKPLRQLLAGGDILSVPHVQKFLETFPNCQIINAYGPTENTTITCCYSITAPLKPGASIPIGYPIAHTHVYILDENQQPVPVGEVGELYIGGDGLARGYLNRPELTAEKFIADPFSSNVEDRLYKSGDLARYLPDGRIEFLGRIDNQVKIRGFRIELGEIERELAQHPHIRDVVVVVRQYESGEKRLVAYIVPHTNQVYTINQFRSFLQERLPDYMLPSAFVILESLPLNANGKVDRKQLPAPSRERPQLEQVYIAPQTDLERLIASIWSEILQIDQVGINDNFFDLGGTSVLIMQVATKLQEKLGIELPVVKLFQYGTISNLAQHLNSQQNNQQNSQKLQNRAQLQKAASARRRNHNER